MAVNFEVIIEKAFEEAFVRALDRTIQGKAESLFNKVLEEGSPLAKRLEEKIALGFEHFIEDGIQWDKKKPGFKKP